MNTGYTDVEVESLLKDGDINLKFGNILIDELESGFSTLEIEAEYADVSIETDANYSFSAAVSFGDIDFPSDMKLTTNAKENHGLEKKVEGSIGSGGNQGDIKVNLKYGHLKVKD